MNEEEKEEEDENKQQQENEIRKNCNSVFCSNAADLYLLTKAIVSLQ